MINRNPANIFTDTQAVIKTENNSHPRNNISKIRLDHVSIVTKFYTTTRIKQVN